MADQRASGHGYICIYIYIYYVHIHTQFLVTYIDIMQIPCCICTHIYIYIYKDITQKNTFFTRNKKSGCIGRNADLTNNKVRCIKKKNWGEVLDETLVYAKICLNYSKNIFLGDVLDETLVQPYIQCKSKCLQKKSFSGDVLAETLVYAKIYETI